MCKIFVSAAKLLLFNILSLTPFTIIRFRSGSGGLVISKGRSDYSGDGGCMVINNSTSYSKSQKLSEKCFGCLKTLKCFNFHFDFNLCDNEIYERISL